MEDNAPPVGVTLGAVQEDPPASPTTKTLAPVPSIMANLNKDMDRIHDQSVVFSGKIDREDMKAKALDAKIKAAEKRNRDLYNQTRGGAVIMDDSAKYKKNIAKLEKTLQTLRIQLSKSNQENIILKNKITDGRTSKLLYLQIHYDMVSQLVWYDYGFSNDLNTKIELGKRICICRRIL